MDTKKYIESQGQEQFLDNQLSRQETYTHIYSQNVTWANNYQLIIKVSGYPDNSQFVPGTRFLLINGSTGSVERDIEPI